MSNKTNYQSVAMEIVIEVEHARYVLGQQLRTYLEAR